MADIIEFKHRNNLKGNFKLIEGHEQTVQKSFLGLWDFLQQTTRVLLVEDDPMTRQLVRKCLKGECMFATATTAQGAIETCDSYNPDVVFLDLGLPDFSGSVVLDWIRLNQPHTTVVLFTNTDDYGLISSLMSKGAVGYIPKPFIRDDFVNYINAEKLF